MQKETSETVTLLNIGGITSKLTRNADKLGVLLGFTTGSPNGFGDVLSTIQNASEGNIHAPNIDVIMTWSGEPYLMTSVMAYLLGEVVDQLGLPMIGKYGSAIKKAAVGYAAGSFANKFLWSMTHSDQGSDPNKGGGSSSGGYHY